MLTLGLNTNDLKMLSAIIVAVFLAVPFWKEKYFHVSAKGKAAPVAGTAPADAKATKGGK